MLAARVVRNPVQLVAATVLLAGGLCCAAGWLVWPAAEPSTPLAVQSALPLLQTAVLPDVTDRPKLQQRADFPQPLVTAELAVIPEDEPGTQLAQLPWIPERAFDLDPILSTPSPPDPILAEIPSIAPTAEKAITISASPADHSMNLPVPAQNAGIAPPPAVTALPIEADELGETLSYGDHQVADERFSQWSVLPHADATELPTRLPVEFFRDQPVTTPALIPRSAELVPHGEREFIPATDNGAGQGILSSATQYRMAEQPAVGDRFAVSPPNLDARASAVPAEVFDFAPGPDWGQTFDPDAANQIYEGKSLNATQRPLVELGRPWYQLGQLSPGSSILGFHNVLTPQLIVFGDFRTALASNQLGGNGESLAAVQANLFFDLKLTSTERFHFNLTPLTRGGQNTRFEFDRHQFEGEWNGDINFGFFEGDLGAITGGAIGKTLPFDLPFAVGAMPLLFQNGVWMDDAILGAAVTIPARNSAALDISNFDTTFFAGFDNIDSAAFENNNDAAKLWGVANFIEALNGYIELDYAYLQDRDQLRDRSYHNIGLGYTRRYGRWLSNSTRLIVNAGQSTDGGENTADGALLLSENSLITANPYTVLPYLNLFAGFDRPQSAARAAAAGGVLRNTGILFETDNLTGYPTLDATANQTFGAALGLSLLPADFSQQLVLETAYVGTMGDSVGRNAAGDQYGAGVRYQLPISNAVILRLDGMYGWLRDSQDISGIRFEFRHKF